ncbi:MAG: LysR family transcriptional regulator [Burkholderiales bacterium]|nr:LysR family transcriptional regulator [Burkholderiales bacterium]
MELRDLHYFEAVAQHGHFGRAAKALFRSQPALTKAINRLEAALGTRLFERTSTGVRLTPAGLAVRARARGVSIAVEDTVREAAAFGSGTIGRIRIGAAPTAAQYLLPGVCRVLLQQAPELTVHTSITVNFQLRRQLLDGEIDVVLGPATPADARLAVHSIVEDHVVVVASREHEIFRRPRIALRDMLDYRWVLPVESHSTEEREWLNSVFRSKGLALPQVQIDTDATTLLPRLIAETKLLSFITRSNLGAGRIGAPLREVKLRATTLQRSLGVIYRRDAYLSPAVQRFVKIAQEQGRKLFADQSR